jgi:DUF4097 and DUF4098 domain-containing protein YvlB
MMTRLRLPHAALAALALVMAGPALAASQSYTKADTYKNPAIKAGGTVSLTNMLGHVTVVPADDGVFSIDSKIVAGADSDQDAQALAAKVKLEITASGNSVTAVAHYPVDEYTSYYYPRGTVVFGMSTTSTEYEGERVRISDGNFGSGINLHTDFTVHVPKGVSLTVDNKVGLIEANKVNAALKLLTGSGDIKGGDNSGNLEAHTGSGDITLGNHSGDLDVETGSGDIVVSQVKGGDTKVRSGSGDLKLNNLAGILTAETGSGGVEVRKFSGAGIDVVTGSGDVVIEDATGSLKAHAGSGDITVTGYKAGDAVDCHTGSGNVNLDGDLAAVVRLSMESGSGDIVVRTTGVPSLHISATSDSGDVNVDFPSMQNVSAHPHSIRADVNGAKGSAELDAGSGDVTFTKH